MTQELDKEAFEIAMAAFVDAPRKKVARDQVAKAIHAYLNTAKVTGFDIGLMEDAISALEDLGACDDGDCIVSRCNRVLPRLKAALAGGK